MKMNRYKHFIVEEWEKTLFAVSAAALLFYLGALLFGFGDEGMPRIGGDLATREGDLLNAATAWTFFRPEPRFTMEFNPFAFEPAIAARPIVRIERPREVAPPRPEPPRPEPPRPPPAKPTRTFKYVGMIELGQAAALVRDIGGNQSLSLLVGGEVAGFKVVAFDGSHLTIVTPSGEAATIAIGEQRTFEVDE